MIRRPPRSTHCISSAASDVYKRQAVSYTTYETESYGGYTSTGSWSGCSLYSCNYDGTNSYGYLVAAETSSITRSYSSFSKYYYSLRISLNIIGREPPSLTGSPQVKLYYKGLLESTFSLSGSSFTCYSGSTALYTTTYTSVSAVIDPSGVSIDKTLLQRQLLLSTHLLYGEL
eukprot:TRINITY_DN11086_c0_g1_i2.p2 TRINITY_DN11086_c0_g1~~TRINITY_DN11086_c0_g1_i2.p2  ORF type:complete len:173 (+),score=16.86 TRINITY_DN11086_c0_g1_i2:129-647(+)